MYKHSLIKQCPITNSVEKIKYFDLGNIPLVNNLCDSREESIKATKFPLNINYYPESGLSSLDFAVDGELMFSHYLFKSEVNIPYYKHCQEMFKYAQNYINIIEDSNIVDIGGNDGTLLDAFRSTTDLNNLNLLNIDPSENLCELSRNKCIPTINEFFGLEVAYRLSDKIDLVTSTNVFQHLKDIESFVKGIEYILSEDGIWILEFPYWISGMETNQFDQIYHEHMYYYSVKPLNILFENNGLKILNVTDSHMHGGSLRIIISKESSTHQPDKTLDKYLSNELSKKEDYHINWGNEILKHISNSRKFIKDLKSQGKTIFGFGAAAKGCIYLNAMGLTDKDISFIIDDTDLKQGKFIPGTGIQVVDRSILNQIQPDYILILPHNFKDFIINSLKDQYKGKFIILIPKISIV